ncbi:DUF1259 domain-containing protein [Paenibacillus hamazuiensis]|uniref:DUF1259 domain-containing protein n=1 Tax=Paenibacillus hamazuiensis TaxID=2936508 RepID=UPI00200D9D7F|nr:DUF1259 domain-containing protein [Paenibacillus hamazuiensis]
MNETVCKQFAEIVGGRPTLENGVCSVSIPRRLRAYIMGRPVRSHHVLGVDLSIESPDARGNTLNLGEISLLQDEIAPFTHRLQNQGILISAIHNHWLFEQPPIYYVHFMSVEPPLQFARKTLFALSVLQM